MHVTILGKRWNLSFVRKSRKRGWAGICSPPDQPNRSITIESGHSPLRELELVIHESIHATCFPLDEEFVTESAADIARILWRLGWRKQGPKQEP